MPIFGTRLCGRVDVVAGEYAATRFAHVLLVPLVPLGWCWVRPLPGGAVRCAPLRPSWRSTVAGYLRTWAPIAAALCAVERTAAAFAVAALLLAAVAWSFRWERVPARTYQRIAAIFGVLDTACEPRRMPAAHADRLRRSLVLAWHEAGRGRTPEDVARFGPDDEWQGRIAQAMLRLAGRDDLADRILDRIREPAVGGPYRAT